MTSAIVHAEDAAAGRTGDSILGSGREESAKLSPALVTLLAVQIFCSVMVNARFGCVFIYVNVAVNTIGRSTPSPSIRPPTPSSSSSTTLITTGTPSCHLQDTAHEYGPKPTKLMTTAKTGKNKKGKQALGAVNGLAQCIISAMCYVGPYGNWLYTRWLELKYGSEPLPESPVFEGTDFKRVCPGDGCWRGCCSCYRNEGEKNDGLAREIAGVLVYGVLLVLVTFTLVVGLRLPAVPWRDEEEEDGDEATAVEDEEDAKIHKR